MINTLTSFGRSLSARFSFSRFAASLDAGLGRIPFVLQMIWVLLLASFLSLWRLSAADLWVDEAISHWIARKPLLEVLTYSLSRAWEHPPSYYVLLHIWMGLLGDSEFALRAFSWLGMTLAVTVIATLARRWFGDRVALLAALIAATNPMMVVHARDARMYAWLMALVPFSVYALDRALRYNRWRDWALFLGVMALAVGMHYLIALVLLCYAIFLAVRWRRLPLASRSRFAWILAVLFVLGVAAFTFLSGPRASLQEGINLFLQTPRTLAPLWDVYAEWALGSNVLTLPPLIVVPLVFFFWTLVLIGIIGSDRLSCRSPLDLRWLFILLVIVPSVIAVVAMPFSSARHTSATIGMALLAATLGVAILYRHARWLGAVVLVALLTLNLGLSAHHIAATARPFATAMDYINARARDGEPVVYTYYFDWPFDSYYNRRDLPYFNTIPERHQDITDVVAQERAAAVIATGAPSLWLMLFPGPENTDRVERAFNELAFPSERVWFPSGRSVIRYFAPRPLVEQSGGLSWNNQIALSNWAVDNHEVAAGDALRLRFHWQRLDTLAEHDLLALTLVGPDGAIWARQVAEPCNGRCATSDWTDAPIVDHTAFYVPPDVPPGDYRLHINWLTQQGTALLGRNAGDPAERENLALMDVRVMPPGASAPAAAPLERSLNDALRDGLILRSVGFQDAVVRVGAAVEVPLQWQVTAPQPELSARLLLERGHQKIALDQPLGAAWHPSATWQPGRILQTRPRFTLPGGLTAGTYQASLSVIAPGVPATSKAIALGQLTVEDRPRRFELPPGGEDVNVTCGEGVHLARFELPSRIAAGATVPLTLTWQAGGATTRNWKVFIHVLDGAGVKRTQNDGYPADGQAWSSSWQPNEVIVDVHNVPLPADLPAGDYTVRLGLYDEQSGERLPCGDGDTVTLPQPLRVHGQ
jgi:mannosyltransferase